MEQTDRGQRSWGTLLLKKVRSKHILIFTVYAYIHNYGEWSCQHVTHCVTILFVHAVAYTSDVMPSGTIPPTTSTSALSPTPTGPAETAGELTLVLKACLYSNVFVLD